MTKHERYHKDEKQVREWFKNHQHDITSLIDEVTKADSSPKTICQKIDWRSRDGSSIYACRYLLMGGILIVTGDLGAATYQWSSPINLQGLATYSIDYFAGKQIASERRVELGHRWCPRMATDQTKAVVKEHVAAIKTVDPKKARTVSDWFTANKFWEDSCLSGAELIHALRKCPLNEHGFLEENLSGVGNVYDVRTIGHLVGLKMIWEQQAAKE